MLHLREKLFSAFTILAAGILASSVLMSTGAFAAGSEPEPEPAKTDCSKKENAENTECFCEVEANKTDEKCQKQEEQQSNLSDDQLYQAAYWLAQKGKYRQALVQLKKAKSQNDPRILNYIGFSTRKLGRFNEALVYYRKALAADPDYTLARAYMGEAFLEQNKLELARKQLSEIKKRCGTSCAEFVELDSQIKSFQSTGKFKPQSSFRG